MPKPLITVVGHCTSTTARLTAVFDGTSSTHAQIDFRVAGLNNIETLKVSLEWAEPFLLATFDLVNLPPGEQGTRIEYFIRSADDSSPAPLVMPSFKLIGTGGNLKFAVVSCNGEYRITDEHRRFRLWKVLKEQCEKGELDFILHVGDQVYADAIKMRYGINLTERKLAKDEKGEIDFLSSKYRQIYVETWRAPEVAAVLSSCPSYMMWDDHEIFDGYGSHDDDKSPAARAFFRAAEKAFLDFQSKNNPPPLGFASHGCAFLLNDSGFIVLDARTNRSYVDGLVLGNEQLEQVRAWLSSTIVRKLRRLYVITAIPIVHVAVVGFINFVHLFGWRGGLVEDLRDSWTAPNNRRECNELLTMLFEFATDSPGCEVTLLSGDAHVGTIAEIESTRQEHFKADGRPGILRQVVSSGIGSPPPQGLAGLILRMAAADKLNLAGPDYLGSLLPFPGRDSCILAQRNFATITEETNGILVRFFVEDGERIEQIETAGKLS